jgi:hypothetical protein
VTWGDGYFNYVTSFPFTLTHSYFYKGTYTIKMNATQSDLTYAVSSNQIVIHGPPYEVNVNFDRTFHLPGDAAKLFVQVDNTTTGAPQIGVQTFFINSCYLSTNTPDKCSPVSTIPSHPTLVANISSYPFTVPPDAVPGSTLSVTVEANETFSTQQISENGSASLSMASPARPDLCAGSTASLSMSVCAPYVASFLPGQNFIATVVALVNTTLGTGVDWANATVTMAFYLNGNPVHPTNLPSTVSLLTNSSGVASTVVVTTGLGTGDLNISVAVSDANNPSLASYAKSRWMFVKLEPAPAVQVQVTLGADEYYGGDMLSGSFAISTISGGHAAGWSANSYAIVAIAPGNLCDVEFVGYSNAYQVLVSSTGVTGAQGTIPSFVLPTSFQGIVDVAVFANNATETWYGQACAIVTPAALLVQTSETAYNPGDTISVTLTPEGNVFIGATYYAEVTCSSSSGAAVIFNQSLGSSTSFSFTIPNAATTLSSCVLTAVAQTTQGIVAGQDVTLYEHSGYALEVSVKTASMYADGSYQPGQSVTFSYTITSLGTSQPPTIFELEAYFQNSAQGFATVEEQSPQGSISMSLPSSLGAGVALVSFGAVIPTPSGTNHTTTTVGILINPSPSFLDYKPLGSSFGMTIGQLILIVVLVVIAIIAILMWRREGGGMYTAKPRKKLLRKDESVEQWNQSQDQQPSQQPSSPSYYPPAGSQTPPPSTPEGGWSPPPMPPSDNPANYPPPAET